MSWKATAPSSADCPKRGFLPPQNDAERTLVRHAEDLARVAQSRGVARYSDFLSDREQDLVQAAMNRAGCNCWHWDGGWPDAERKVLCIEPEDSYPVSPVVCIRIQCRLGSGAAAPQHKDYLGSLMGLSMERESLGDIVLPPDQEGTAYVFALENAARLILMELDRIGNIGVSCTEVEEIPQFQPVERQVQTATVSSLRLDAVLAAMLRCSRGQAADLIAAGRVEINHVPATSAHAPVYVEDIFTVRGKGRFQLTDLPGKSKKAREIIAFFRF